MKENGTYVRKASTHRPFNHHKFFKLRVKSQSSMVIKAATIMVLLVGSFGCAPNPSVDLSLETPTDATATPLPINISSDVPSELNPDGGGAPNATLQQAAAFAWQEFIALNWPAVPQNGDLNNRDTADTSKNFGDPTYNGPLVWHTFRSKAEIYPGQGNPNGYMDDPTESYGYDSLPSYIYNSSFGSTGQVPPFSPGTSDPTTPWINLDENSEIGLNTMYAGVAQSLPANGQIMFLAKANRAEYVYVAENKYWAKPTTTPAPIANFPPGTIEVKSAWRQLTPDESMSGRFYQTTVRYYRNSGTTVAYVDEVWGMVALHIIQKTPSSPYFIYATFSQADNILDVDGNHVEDEAGNLIRNQAATPLEPNIVSQNATINSEQTLTPGTSNLTLTDIGSRLYYKNLASNLPQGLIALNKREHNIPDTIISANQAAHTAIDSYNQANGFVTSPWLYYKLVNVQYKPYDKQPGITYTGAPDGPDPSTYYQANEVVESDYNLQVFSGTFQDNTLITDYKNGEEYKNVTYNGSGYLMGGCMGCHGNAQAAGADFSFIFAFRPVSIPQPIGDEPALDKFKNLFPEK